MTVKGEDENLTRRLLKAFFLILMAGILVLSAIPALADGPAAETETKQESETKQEEDELYAVVKYTSSGRINLRLGPTAASERITALDPGTKAKVLKNLGNWALIEANGFTGYMSTFYLDFYLNGKPTQLPAVEVKIIEVPVQTTAQTTTTQTTFQTSQYQAPAHRAGYYDRASWPVVENTTMYVSTANGGSLRLRYQPTTDSAVAGNYPVGTVVTVLNRSNYWAYVNVNGANGFMMLQHLAYTQPSPPVPPVPPTPVGTATVTHPRGSFVNLRSSRTTDTDRNILARVPHGTVVDVVAWDTWYSTVTYNGITGYMVTSYLVP